MRLRDELASRLADRSDLASEVIVLLEADPRVRRVELAGSLAGGKSDVFSDIDLVVHLQEDVVDREVFFDLPNLVHAVGPGVAGWGFDALPQTYVATFHFDDHPLFWEVDVGVRGGRHVDGSDLVSRYRWEQIYKMWVLAAKYLVRSDLKLADVARLVSRYARVDVPDGASASRLFALLDGIKARKIERGDPYHAFHKRCEHLAESIRLG